MKLRVLVLTMVLAGAAYAGPDLERGLAPNFSARAVDGSRVDLAKVLAKGPVVLDFWATWCRPCEHSLPAAQALHVRLRERGVSVIGVSIDGPRNWARVRPFSAKLGLTFPIVIDEDGALARRFQITGVPTTVLIAADGRVARVHSGFVPGEDRALAAAAEALLRPAPGDTAR